MDWVACVGVDWGDKEHAYEIQPREGPRTKGRLKSSAEDVHEWVRGLREQFPIGVIVVALEQGRASLVYALMSHADIAVAPLNPRASKAYRESQRLSGASSDPLDAGLICDFAVKHIDTMRMWKPDDQLTRKLRLLVETRRTLVEKRTALTHQLSAALKEYFPQPLQWFDGESSPLLRAFLTRWPTMEMSRTATADELADMMRECRRRKVAAAAKDLADKIRLATPLIDDAAIIDARSMYVQSLIALIEPLESEIKRYDTVIAELWTAHPDREIFDSLPGAGPVLAPRLAVAFGLDRSRYHDADEIQCYSGIAPVTEASGRAKWVHARWAFPTFLHQTFHEFAEASTRHSAWANAFYKYQRDQGADRHAAIRALAFRWIRILLRIWQAEDTYDEARYIETLRKKQSPIAARLAT
jgi:transposase